LTEQEQRQRSHLPQKYFGIPHGCEVRIILAVGYAVDNSPVQKIRKPLEEVCSFNKWE
jgi:hypothetical protein